MLHHLWRRLLATPSSSQPLGRTQRSPCRRPRTILGLEPLEERTLLSAVSFTNADNNNQWDDAQN